MHSDGKKRRSFVALLLPPVIWLEILDESITEIKRTMDTF
jgi:hypothetical protein